MVGGEATEGASTGAWTVGSGSDVGSAYTSAVTDAESKEMQNTRTRSIFITKVEVDEAIGGLWRVKLGHQKFRGSFWSLAAQRRGDALLKMLQMVSGKLEGLTRRSMTPFKDPAMTQKFGGNLAAGAVS
jgi:hypothetical protein